VAGLVLPLQEWVVYPSLSGPTLGWPLGGERAMAHDGEWYRILHDCFSRPLIPLHEAAPPLLTELGGICVLVCHQKGEFPAPAQYNLMNNTITSNPSSLHTKRAQSL
jgi:hypothetical protein